MSENVKLYEVLDDNGIAYVHPSGGREVIQKGGFIWSNDVEKGLFKESHLDFAEKNGRLKRLSVKKESKIMPKGDTKDA